MLLTISFTFLVTTLPLTVVSIAAAFVGRTSGGRDELTASRFKLARTIAELLMYANHAINFYLYCATGQKFRHQLIWMVCYSRRTYWLPGDVDRRSPAPSAAASGRHPSEKQSPYMSGARLAMRAGDAVILRRMAHSNNSAGIGGSAGGGGGGGNGAASHQQTAGGGGSQRSQLNVVVVDTVCTPGGATLDVDEQQSCRDITTAPCTDNSVL